MLRKKNKNVNKVENLNHDVKNANQSPTARPSRILNTVPSDTELGDSLNEKTLNNQFDTIHTFSSPSQINNPITNTPLYQGMNRNDVEFGESFPENRFTNNHENHDTKFKLNPSPNPLTYLNTEFGDEKELDVVDRNLHARESDINEVKTAFEYDPYNPLNENPSDNLDTLFKEENRSTEFAEGILFDHLNRDEEDSEFAKELVDESRDTKLEFAKDYTPKTKQRREMEDNDNNWRKTSKHDKDDVEFTEEELFYHLKRNDKDVEFSEDNRIIHKDNSHKSELNLRKDHLKENRHKDVELGEGLSINEIHSKHHDNRRESYVDFGLDYRLNDPNRSKNKERYVEFGQDYRLNRKD